MKAFYRFFQHAVYIIECSFEFASDLVGLTILLKFRSLKFNLWTPNLYLLFEFYKFIFPWHLFSWDKVNNPHFIAKYKSSTLLRVQARYKLTYAFVNSFTLWFLEGSFVVDVRNVLSVSPWRSEDLIIRGKNFMFRVKLSVFVVNKFLIRNMFRTHSIVPRT